MIDQPLQAGIDHDEHRHAQQHADEAEQAAAEQDGEHDPETVNAGGIAKDLRADDIAVDLLQDDDENDVNQALHRRDEQNDQRRRHRADERAEHGDDIRHGDDHAHEHDIRHAHDRTADIADDADDGGINDLTADKAHERRVREANGLEDALGRLDGKHAVEHHLGLCEKQLHIRQHIAGDDEADEHIEDRTQNGIDAGRHARDHLAHGRQQRGLRPVEQTVGHIAGRGEEHFLYLGIVFKELVDPAGDRVIVLLIVEHDALNARIDLRDDEPDEGGDDDQGDQNREHNGQAARKRGAHRFFRAELFEQRLKELALEYLRQRPEQVGDHQAPDDRAKDAEQRADRIADGFAVLQQHVKQNAARDHAERRDAPAEVFVFRIKSLHKPSPPSRPQRPPVSVISRIYFTIMCPHRQAGNTGLFVHLRHGAPYLDTL